jgi:hypothetical protein
MAPTLSTVHGWAASNFSASAKACSASGVAANAAAPHVVAIINAAAVDANRMFMTGKHIALHRLRAP